MEIRWEILNLGESATLADYLEIIEDATCYGFIFKIENHTVYWADAQ